MGLLRGSWSEVFTLSILFRSLPTTVAAAGLAAKEVSNGVKRKLKFAPDYAMTQTIANQCGLQAFYEQVHSYILHISCGWVVRDFGSEAKTRCNF